MRGMVRSAFLCQEGVEAENNRSDSVEILVGMAEGEMGMEEVWRWMERMDWGSVGCVGGGSE